ncbi:MAG TPA: methyl-accepting chemotaxis protein, partial [Thiotrichales bacterium]|nr:methyl-accepting chemotaxis protein [Thiotrichales bacterium]
IAVMAFTLAVPAWTGHLDWRTAGMSLILPALFVFAYYLWDVRPLCRMFARARSIFDNPIARYVYTGRNDEVGQVMLALRHLEAEAAALVGRMDDSAEDLRHSADRLRSAIVSSKQNIDRQHAETDMVATAVTEMSASIQEVASNAERSAEAAGTAHERTIESKEVVNKTMQAIQELASDVQNASEVIARLSENSERISSIVNVITGIAEQTNLLALNAAIEAARAGEQGRGFAVVADEVRTLANRTHDSTSEIQEMIEQLQEGAKQAVQVMEQSLAKTDSSVERGREAVGSLDAVTEAIARITDMSVQIAAAVAEQKEVAQEVARSVTNIQDLSRISVEAMEESETAGLQVAKESDELKALTGQFWERRR